MSKMEKILFAFLSLVLILGTIWVIQGWQSWRQSSTLSSNNYQPLNYNQAKQAEDPANPCEPPAGYTEESWREHMSHHPEQYKECLNN